MSQQYELKVGVYSDERLQVADLLKYLEAETNESIASMIKKLALGAKPTQRFTSTFQRIPDGEIEEQEYVGFLMIYNSSQFESIEYVKQILAELGLRGSDETFLILVQTETKDKVNLANQEGSILASKYNADFVRLSFENTGELLRTISKYISQMLESYYHPTSVIGQEEEQQEEVEYDLNYISRDKQRELQQDEANRPLFEQNDEPTNLLDRALQQRKSRMKDITQQEHEIDTNIQNLQKVLQNMDVHIRSKVETDWFSNLKNSIYSRVEKESESYSKIKLTQHFLKQTADSKVQKVPVETILIKRRRNLLMRLQLTFNKSQVLVEVFADSSYPELARIALRKIGLKLSDKNVLTMRNKIQQTVDAFVEQLSRSIEAIQEQKLASRRLLK